MKEKNKIIRLLVTFIITVLTLVTSIATANAAADSIQLGTATDVKPYVGGVKFAHKVTTDGKDLYCINMHKSTAQNIKANLVKNSKNITGGLVYILKNGYPNKSITGDKDKDYYITQTAIWWYLDKTTGSSNLGNEFKQNGSDAYGLRQYIKNLMAEGYTHRNDALDSVDAKLTIAAVNGNTMTLKDGYYTSNDIKATMATNISSYTVTLTNAPSGTKIVLGNGAESNYSEGFKVNKDDTFKIKVPSSAMDRTTLSIKVTAKAQSGIQYMAYEYQPEDSNMQNVALLEKTSKTVTSEMNLEIASSKVTVIKVDSNTKQPLAGAKLVLKNSSGKEITNWTTTTNGHVIRNLSNGTYTIEEVEAPNGYILNKNITKFTLSDTNRNIRITIENAPQKSVVNILKIDQETKQPLAGAILVVKDSNGTEIVRFTTSNTAYVLNDLKNGTYTVEEVSAPEGYITSNDKITFTIDDNHLSHQITFINAKAVIVPNTSSLSSTILLIIGMIIIACGIRFVYKNGQRI